ncbi:MAG TPA: hypothetical protein VIM41_09080 [Gammaproteobacteria bacterium]
MEGISDIKIIGIDNKRPPIIRKEPYIDIVFKLSHQAPMDWCKEFNALLSKHPSTPRIKDKEGLYIEAWVRTPDEIAALLKQLKDTVAECSRQYIERVELSLRNTGDANALLAQQGAGEQGRLNRIIADLDFGDIKAQ